MTRRQMRRITRPRNKAAIGVKVDADMERRIEDLTESMVWSMDGPRGETYMDTRARAERIVRHGA